MAGESISWRTYLASRPAADIPPAADDVLPILQNGSDVKKIKWSDVMSGSANYVADTGAVNALVADFTPNFTTYIAGLPLRIKVAVTNTGAATLAVDGMAAKAVKKYGSADLEPGDLVAGDVITLVYDGVNFQLLTPAHRVYGRKNVLINGGFDIWQRGTTFVSSAAQPIYTSDRWLYYRSGYALSGTLSRVPGTSGSTTYGLKMQRNAGNVVLDASRIAQILEAVDVKKFAGRTMTISFWAKAGANYSVFNSVLGAIIITGTVADQGSVALTLTGWTGETIQSTDFILTGAMARYTASFAIPANALEVAIILTTGDFIGEAGADDSVTIEQVQLEEGPVATSFEFRPIAQELALCKRYYEKIGGENANDILFASYQAMATQLGAQSFTFSVEKRVAPTGLRVGTWTTTNCSQPGITAVSKTSFALNTTNAVGGYFAFSTNGPTTYLTLDAEL